MAVLSWTNFAPRRLGLLGRLGADVVRGHDRAEAARGADRLEAGDADPEDQDVRGLGRAGRGGQQREVLAVRVRGDEDGLVAADVRLRRQGVHRLGAAQRPRDGVEAHGRDARGGEGLHQRRVEERLQQADDGLAAAQLRRLGGSGLLDAQDDVAGGVQLVGGHDRRPGVRERLVGDRGTGACACLDENLEPGRRQLAERFGHQGDAPFSGRGLPGDADFHGHHRP